ncbi:MAG: efflux transporter outer membrane subunit [Betaproteobacteria bacterium]
MKMTLKPTLIAMAAVASLSACTVGPDYQRPKMDLPPSHAAIPAGATLAQPSSNWWTTFNDPLLDRVMAEALKNNLDLAAAAARVTEAQAQLGLAVSDQVPSVYAAASRERNRNSEASTNSGPGQPLQSTNNRVTLNVSYEIDFWGKYRRASEAARAELLSVEANRDALRLSLATQVVQGYFNLLSLDSRIAATELAVKRGQEALDLQKKRFDAGVISEFDFQQRSAEVDAGRAQLPPLQSQRGNQERALNVLLGRSPREIMAGMVERSSAFVPGNAIVAPSGLPSALLLRRPDLVEAEQKLAAANARIGVARAAYFPAISLTGLLGTESSSLGDLFSGPSRIWNFAGNLTQPLWGAGRINHQVEVAEARNEQAVAQYRNAIANAFREVQDAIQAQAAAREVFDIEQRRVTSLTKSWNLAKLRYENGVASQLDVIDAERNLLLAELNRIEAERGLRAAVADLYKALGG